jgi:DNA-binding NtrC family response regulator
MVHAVAGRPAEEQLTARILVVDDEPGMRKSLAIMLRRERYDVTETSSVADAVGCLKRDAFHLVIADLMMEPLGGLDLLALAREYRPACPVIIITAFGSPEARAEALHRGAVDFMEKPLQAPHLLQRVRELVESHER